MGHRELCKRGWRTKERSVSTRTDGGSLTSTATLSFTVAVATNVFDLWTPELPTISLALLHSFFDEEQSETIFTALRGHHCWTPCPAKKAREGPAFKEHSTEIHERAEETAMTNLFFLREETSESLQSQLKSLCRPRRGLSAVLDCPYHGAEPPWVEIYTEATFWVLHLGLTKTDWRGLERICFWFVFSEEGIAQYSISSFPFQNSFGELGSTVFCNETVAMAESMTEKTRKREREEDGFMRTVSQHHFQHAGNSQLLTISCSEVCFRLSAMFWLIPT